MDGPEVPRDLQCPITFELLYDAVIVSPCGHTFNKEGIQQHFQALRSSSRPVTCPICRKLADGKMVPNYFARNAVEEWAAQHANGQPVPPRTPQPPPNNRHNDHPPPMPSPSSDACPDIDPRVAVVMATLSSAVTDASADAPVMKEALAYMQEVLALPSGKVLLAPASEEIACAFLRTSCAEVRRACAAVMNACDWVDEVEDQLRVSWQCAVQEFGGICMAAARWVEVTGASFDPVEQHAFANMMTVAMDDSEAPALPEYIAGLHWEKQVFDPLLRLVMEGAPAAACTAAAPLNTWLNVRCADDQAAVAQYCNARFSTLTHRLVQLTAHTPMAANPVLLLLSVCAVRGPEDAGAHLADSEQALFPALKAMLEAPAAVGVILAARFVARMAHASDAFAAQCINADVERALLAHLEGSHDGEVRVALAALLPAMQAYRQLVESHTQLNEMTDMLALLSVLGQAQQQQQQRQRGFFSRLFRKR